MFELKIKRLQRINRVHNISQMSEEGAHIDKKLK